MPARDKLTGKAAATEVAVYVTPRASRTELAGDRDGALWVRLAAPPVDGAANQALVAFLAEQLGVPRASVTLAAGATARRKRVRVAGLDAAAIQARLARGGHENTRS